MKIAISCLFCLFMAGQVIADDPSKPTSASIQAQLDSAITAFKEAQAVFGQSRLPESSDYKDALARLNAAKASLDSARDGSGDVAAAAEEKMAAKANLDSVVKRLQDADPQVAAAEKNVASLQKQLSVAKAAEAEAAKQAQAAADQSARQAAANAEKDRVEALSAKRAEYQQILVNPAGGDAITNMGKVPLVGDEVNTAEVLANWQQYLDKPFVMTGVASIDDYYNFGYLNAKGTHYSFEFWPVNKSGETGRKVNLYSSRDLGDEAEKVLAKYESDNPGQHVLMRFRATVSSQFVRSADDVAATYEVLDWQFFSQKGEWSAWHSEVEGSGNPRRGEP